MHSSNDFLDHGLFPPPSFPDWKRVESLFQTKEFKALTDQEQYHFVSSELCVWILAQEEPCFLLPSLLAFMDEVHALGGLEGYQFGHFELWLNQFSGLSLEENYKVRAKIVGKYLPREEYQILFPIGMGKTYPGSHVVTAHGSPDLDTTVASFWGWVDAFGAKVSENLHLWNLPGGPPQGNVEISLLFEKMFSSAIFRSLAKTKTALSLSGFDLMNQKGVVRQGVDISMKKIDHDGLHSAVVLVDDRGLYLGDWRGDDVEGVRRVATLLSECFRWFASHFYIEIIQLLGSEKISEKEFALWVGQLLNVPLKETLPLQDLSERQKQHLKEYLTLVLGVKLGLESSFKQFAQDLVQESAPEFKEFIDLLENSLKKSLFDASGKLCEERVKIFERLEQLAKSLELGIRSIRSHMDQLKIALQIKQRVFQNIEDTINYRAEIEEIRAQMGDLSYVTVTATGRHGKLEPLGVIHASDIHRATLGTVTLRDFCNRDETKIPPYFEVISVIDHHKSHLQTLSAPLVYISDAQSSNVLCAELAFRLNDRYALSGMTKEGIANQIQEVIRSERTSDRRILQRLLKRELVKEHGPSYFVSPEREYAEYLHFLYAILDDTDLLSKVTSRDVACVVSLLNRLKSLEFKKEVEVISLEDIPRDEHFAKKAAERILKNPEMQSFYAKVYSAKEKAVDENLKIAAEGGASSLFLDVKVQNKCARVGQTKLFPSNLPAFESFESILRARWAQEALYFWKEHPDVDMHLHMISTVAGVNELISPEKVAYQHLDALWIWIPFTEVSIEHLKRFLSAFKNSLHFKGKALSLEFCGDKAQEYQGLFQEGFIQGVPQQVHHKKVPSLVILRYPAGLLNSRKSAISPYLPSL